MFIKKNKRILFIYPNTSDGPVISNAISILAGIARDLSWAMDYFDTYCYKKLKDSMEDRERTGEFKPSSRMSIVEFKESDAITIDLQNKIDTFMPSIIAISCMTLEYEFLMNFFPNIHVPKETLVIIGGIHATLVPDEVINSGLFDLVFVGEGEVSFKEVLTKFERGVDLNKIRNTYYRNKNSGRIAINKRIKLLNEDDLWKIIPDYSFFNEKYFLYPFDGKLYKRYSFETARGCPYNCAYCGNTALKETIKGLGKFVRTRPIESIKENLEKMVYSYGIEMLYLEDECFLSHSSSWLKDFAEWYRHEIKKPFIIQTRPETITEEKIQILEHMNAPFFQVSVGVESGSEKILFQVCKRKTKVSKIIDAFKLLHKHSIRNCAFFMIGFPYETREDIFDSIKLCRRIKPTVAIVSIFTPFPGLPLRELCIREGFITGKESLPTFTERSILKMPQITSEEITSLRRVFLLYVTLPEKYYPQIEKCEKDYYGNKHLYDELVNLRWTYSR